MSRTWALFRFREVSPAPNEATAGANVGLPPDLLPQGGGTTPEGVFDARAFPLLRDVFGSQVPLPAGFADSGVWDGFLSVQLINTLALPRNDDDGSLCVVAFVLSEEGCATIRQLALQLHNTGAQLASDGRTLTLTVYLDDTSELAQTMGLHDNNPSFFNEAAQHQGLIDKPETFWKRVWMDAVATSLATPFGHLHEEHQSGTTELGFINVRGFLLEPTAIFAVLPPLARHLHFIDLRTASLFGRDVLGEFIRMLQERGCQQVGEIIFGKNRLVNTNAALKVLAGSGIQFDNVILGRLEEGPVDDINSILNDCQTISQITWTRYRIFGQQPLPTKGVIHHTSLQPEQVDTWRPQQIQQTTPATPTASLGDYDVGQASTNDKAKEQMQYYWVLPEVHRVAGMGAAQKVAVLDSGIDVFHKAFAGRIAAAKSFVPGEHSLHDANGHGTHCAGLVASIAPQARLYIGKIFNAAGNGSHEGTGCSCRLGVFQAIQRAVLQGIIVVVAAANEGRLHQYSIGYPARYGNVLCVGSHTDKGQVSGYSSVGREVDFLAPGEDIISCAPGNKYVKMSGTSMATPLVAGLVALLLPLRPELQDRTQRSVVQVRALLRAMASKSGHHDEAMGYGILRPYQVLRFCGGEDPFAFLATFINE